MRGAVIQTEMNRQVDLAGSCQDVRAACINRVRRGSAVVARAFVGLGLGCAAHASAVAPPAHAEALPNCLEWQSPSVDIIEGRFLKYGRVPNVRYAMGQVDLGFGVVRTVIELSWQAEAASRNQTLFDATTAGDFAGGVSFYRVDDALITEYLQCSWDADGCRAQRLSYEYDASTQQFQGVDRDSADAIMHLCAPAYFDSERALRRTRR